jgi:hypothetical protein
MFDLIGLLTPIANCQYWIGANRVLAVSLLINYEPSAFKIGAAVIGIEPA